MIRTIWRRIKWRLKYGPAQKRTGKIATTASISTALRDLRDAQDAQVRALDDDMESHFLKAIRRAAEVHRSKENERS